MKLSKQSIFFFGIYFLTQTQIQREKSLKKQFPLKNSKAIQSLWIRNNVQIKEELHQKLECVLSILFWILLVCGLI
jgi:hypothetical protein